MSASFSRLVINCSTESLPRVCRSIRFTTTRGGPIAGYKGPWLGLRLRESWEGVVELRSFNDSVRWSTIEADGCSADGIYR